MPETVKLYRVFLGAPSDVVEEQTVIRGILDEWNIQHGHADAARVELVHWSTHSYPAAGKRPQALINKQAFDRSDIVVGIFWSKFGSPTGVAASGTEEEIRRGISQGKKVLVYFSARPAAKRKPLEFSRIQRFKRKFGQKALYWVYSDIGSFEKSFRSHIAAVMHELTNRRRKGKR